MTMTIKEKITAWLQLTRFDKPIGTELLLYPTLWSLFLAGAEIGRLPNLAHVVIFSLGAILMRASGCAINDFADRRVDGKVKRTKGRPLVDGRLSPKTALMTFLGLSLLSACLLLFLPFSVFYWSLIAVGLAFIYPFMKRYTHLPQVVLAAAFGWAVPMAYVATTSHVSIWGWVVFLAYMCWTIGYDTQYAMCDRDDDVNIGIKSTAILFGYYDVLIIMTLLFVFVLLMAMAVWHYVGGVFCLLIMPVLLSLAYQYQLIKHRDRLACFRAFRHNAWVGRYVFGVVLISCIWRFG